MSSLKIRFSEFKDTQPKSSSSILSKSFINFLSYNFCNKLTLDIFLSPIGQQNNLLGVFLVSISDKIFVLVRL